MTVQPGICQCIKKIDRANEHLAKFLALPEVEALVDRYCETLDPQEKHNLANASQIIYLACRNMRDLMGVS